MAHTVDPSANVTVMATAVTAKRTTTPLGTAFLVVTVLAITFLDGADCRLSAQVPKARTV